MNNKENLSPQILNLLCIVHDSRLYGAQFSLLQLLAGVDRGIIRPYVVAENDGPLIEHLKQIGIAVKICRTGKWVHAANSGSLRDMLGMLRRLPRSVFEIIKYMRKHRTDVVYTNTVASLSGAIAAKLLRKPHIWHLREKVNINAEGFTYIPDWVKYRLITFLSDRVVTNTYHMRETLAQGICEPIEVVHNGVNLGKFNPRVKSVIRSELKIGRNKRIVAIIGSISQNKGQEIFIKACSAVKKRHPATAFLVIGGGDPEYITMLKALSEECNLTDSVFFLGWRSDINEILTEIDILVLASYHEPFGKIIIEAMAAAKPVVATRSGGPEEIVLHERTGLLVPKGDPQTMADAVLRILVDDNMAKQFGLEGKKLVAAEFSEKKYVERLQRIIFESAAQKANKKEG